MRKCMRTDPDAEESSLICDQALCDASDAPCERQRRQPELRVESLQDDICRDLEGDIGDEVERESCVVRRRRDV